MDRDVLVKILIGKNWLLRSPERIVAELRRRRFIETVL
jgi:hypothetical protein